MDSSVLRRHGSTLLALMVALTVGSSALKATGNLLTATASATTLTCNTATGTTPATIVVKPVTALTGSATIAVTYAAVSGGISVSPANGTLNSTNGGSGGVGLTFTVTFAAGCTGVTNLATTPVQFKQAGTNDVSVTLTTNLTATTSGLSASPSPVTISCVAAGSSSPYTYTVGPAVTVNVLSNAANIGTPFTPSTLSSASWLVVNGSGGTATTSSAVSLTVQASNSTDVCHGLAPGQTATTTFALGGSSNDPGKTISVTLQVTHPSPLTAIAPVTLSYVKGSGSPGKASVNIASVSVPSAFFAVDTTTLPSWLTVNYASGSAPKTIQFSSTTVCDSLAPGTYNATVANGNPVRINVSGYGPLSVSVSLLITNTAPKLTVAEGTTRNISWTIGNALPTPVITATSSDTPIPYTVTSGGTLAPIIPNNELSGLAYSFGTPINVSFNSLLFASATPNSVLTGTVTLSYGSNSSIVVTFNITVVSPASTLSGVSPSTIPTATTGTVTVSLTGTGFIVSSIASQKTQVGIIQSGSTITADPNFSWQVLSGSTIQLTISVNSTDTLMPFASGGNVTIGVCNPTNGSCSTAGPGATQVLAIGSYPIIQAVTSSSALVQASLGIIPSVAPYDMISIFGSNFCPICSSSQVLYGAPDPVLMTYPVTLSPDSGTHNLSVTFWVHPGSGPDVTQLGTVGGPMLFATNSQINLLVPSTVAAQIGSEIDVVVNYGTAHSAPYPVNLIATDPGIFTIGADGQGSGAILNSAYALVGSANPAGARHTSTDSDIVQVYMTGLGIPDSTADDTAAGGSAAWSADCASTASFLTEFNSVTGNSLTGLDGTLVNPSAINTNRLAPCLLSSGTDVPTVTFGGQPGVVKYAGWVAGTVAGLYQINVQLPPSTAASGHFTTTAGATPTTLTTPVQLPVVVTSNSVSSQSGVYLWVTPSLKVEPILGDGSYTFVTSGTVGVPWSGSNNLITATEGTSPYTYAVTSGLLPAGLSLVNGGTTASITGTPAAGTAGNNYVVTVTATDSAAVPLTGSATFTLTVAGGLYETNTVPYASLVAGTAHAVSTITATSGVAPYAYTITSSPQPTGITLVTNAGATGTLGIGTTTPAGNYTVTVTGTDSTTGTPLTGADPVTFHVALDVTSTSLVVPGAGTSGTLTTVSATGNNGILSYALDPVSLAKGWTINSSGVISTTSATAGTYTSGTTGIVVTVTDGTAPTGGTAATTTYNVPTFTVM